MKKLLFLIPIGLLASTGFFWIASEHKLSSEKNENNIQRVPKSSQELFSDSEHSLRQIIRHGDEHAISELTTSLNAISTELSTRQQQGLTVKNITLLISQYKSETALISNKFLPYLKKMSQYDHYEQVHENKFITAIDQIGLYELKTSYHELNKLRTDFIKEPSEARKAAYEMQAGKIKQIISELYLDAKIEKPLFDYLTIHKLYFETLSSAYNDTGYESIHHLRTNSYAIKTELQLLPIL
ncbi:MAG: hypothetical protein PHO27_08565 [Sulfuricurvum sp.]|nr:hypothetical protein [Sulfuricurvum sp.]